MASSSKNPPKKDPATITIVSDDEEYHEYDDDFYEGFIEDPAPASASSSGQQPEQALVNPNQPLSKDQLDEILAMEVSISG